MTRLHHVPWGRSFRVLWLLQEMGITPDEIIRYRIGAPEMRGAGLMVPHPRAVSPRWRSTGSRFLKVPRSCNISARHGPSMALAARRGMASVCAFSRRWALPRLRPA